MNNIVAQLALTLPANPTSADVLRVLVQAEQAGYDRAVMDSRSYGQFNVPSILRRQAE